MQVCIGFFCYIALRGIRDPGGIRTQDPSIGNVRCLMASVWVVKCENNK